MKITEFEKEDIFTDPNATLQTQLLALCVHLMHGKSVLSESMLRVLDEALINKDKKIRQLAVLTLAQVIPDEPDVIAEEEESKIKKFSPHLLFSTQRDSKTQIPFRNIGQTFVYPVNKLVERLTAEKEDDIKKTIMDILSVLGKQDRGAIDALIAIVKNKKEKLKMRASAINILTRIAEKNWLVMDILLTIMLDEKEELGMRVAAISGVTTLSHPSEAGEVKEKLLSIVKNTDTNSELRVLALQCFYALVPEDETAQINIIPMMLDIFNIQPADGDMRQFIIDTLGHIGYLGAGTKLQAIEALEKINTEEAKKWIKSLRQPPPTLTHEELDALLVEVDSLNIIMSPSQKEAAKEKHLLKNRRTRILNEIFLFLDSPTEATKAIQLALSQYPLYESAGYYLPVKEWLETFIKITQSCLQDPKQQKLLFEEIKNIQEINKKSEKISPNIKTTGGYNMGGNT